MRPAVFKILIFLRISASRFRRSLSPLEEEEDIDRHVGEGLGRLTVGGEERG